MKLANILSMENFPTDTPRGPKQPPLAKVDPENIPTEVLTELTPNLETDEKKKELVDPFPDEYIPSKLNSLKINVESIDYTTALAETNLNLLQSTMDIVHGETEIPPMSMASIAAQLDVTKRTSLPFNTEVSEQLEKLLTSDGPYKHIVTMEALVKTLAALRPVITSGLKTITNVNNFITKEVNTIQLAKELEASQANIIPSERKLDNDISDKNSLRLLPMIIKGVENGHEPDQIPDYISRNGGQEANVPVTACALISKSLKSFPLTKSKPIDVEDILATSNYYETVISAQKAAMRLLDSVLANLNVSELSEKGINIAAADIKQQTGLFWSSILKSLKISEDLNNQTLQISNTQGAKLIEVMPNWPGVVVYDTGKSIAPEVVDPGTYGHINDKNISDIATAMLTKAMPKFNIIVKNSNALSQKVEQISSMANQTLADNSILSDVGFTNFQSTFFRMIDVVKLMGNLTFVAAKSVICISNSITDASRGIAILRETV